MSEEGNIIFYFQNSKISPVPTKKPIILIHFEFIKKKRKSRKASFSLRFKFIILKACNYLVLPHDVEQMRLLLHIQSSSFDNAVSIMRINVVINLCEYLKVLLFSLKFYLISKINLIFSITITVRRYLLFVNFSSKHFN